MSAKTFLSVTGAITLVWVLGLLFVPPFALAVEQAMLAFLAATA